MVQGIMTNKKGIRWGVEISQQINVAQQVRGEERRRVRH